MILLELWFGLWVWIRFRRVGLDLGFGVWFDVGLFLFDLACNFGLSFGFDALFECLFEVLSVVGLNLCFVFPLNLGLTHGLVMH